MSLTGQRRLPDSRGNRELDLDVREELEDAVDATVVFFRQVLVEGAQIRYRDGDTRETETGGAIATSRSLIFTPIGRST